MRSALDFEIDAFDLFAQSDFGVVLAQAAKSDCVFRRS
jgi:hypothetical protein